MRLRQTLSALRNKKLSRKSSRIRLGLIESLEDRRMMAVFENFDSVTAPALPAGWLQTATQVNTWGTVASSSDTAPNHAFVANVDVISESILTSPSFVLSAATPLVQFRNSFATEQDFDGGVFEIAINGGAFADILAAGGSFISGGYVGALATGSGNPIAGRAAWHGNSSGYITTSALLPAAAVNQNVQLRWRFGTDSSVSVTGWRIDTISLESVPTDDFGDAPAPFPVTLAENGARHTPGALRLGTNVDLESDGVHSVNADFDGSDEDGVTINGALLSGLQKSISVIASQAGGLLNAWIDWNVDGDWADANEQIFTNQVLAAGSNVLNVNVPTGLNAATSFARFRLSSVAGLSFTGAATDGEVEDYKVAIAVPGVGNWEPLGPFGATNGQVEGIANRPVVGAIHTVLAHPTNADILYVGSVNGGVWKSTNATSAQPNWTPLTDSMPSQSIGALVFDLADATSNTIYAGTGRYSSFGQIGNSRIGLMRSTDGGLNWQVVDGGGVLRGKNISGIYANGNTVVVSVNVADSFTFSNIGIFRSTNGGATFTQIASGNGAATGLPGGVSYDLVYDPITPSTLYTSTVFSDLVGGLNGVYKSTNSGATWTRVSSPAVNALITSNTSNLELAAGRNNEVYAAIINGGAMAGLFRSGDNGGTWVQMDSPRTNENGIDVGLNPSGGKGPQSGAPEAIAGGQGNIHFSIVADPTNANIVYVGGDRQPRTNGDTGGFPNSIGAQDFSGRLFRGNASQPTGSQFVHLTHRNDVAALPGGGTASNSSPHADSREMTFDAAGNLVEVDDGGVYRRTSPRTNTGDWFSVIGDLQSTEAHDVAWDSLSDVAMSGNQDTGTTYQSSAGAATWVSISTGDGGDVVVDNIERAANGQSVRYTSFQNLGGLRRTTWNAAGVLQTTSFPALTPLGGAPSISGAFRTPVETNTVAGGRLLILGSNGLYESLTGGSTVSRIGTVGINNITTNALAYGGVQNNVNNPDVVWAAIGSDVFLRTAGTGSVSATLADPTGATIRDLAVNSRDWANAFVIDDNQVFQTTNAGSSWADITGTSFPAGTEFWSLAFVAGPLSSAVMLGTNIGIFMMSTLEVGVWDVLGSDLPRVLTYDMDYDATDDILVAGTLGRGAWALNNVTTLLAGNTAPVIASNSAAVSGAEGTNITNAGTWSDADASDVVTLTASVGTVIKNVNGTWSWSIPSTDNQAATNVIITANDGQGGVSTTTFSYTVDNVAPAVAATNATVSGVVLSTITNTGTWSDVAADTVSLSASTGAVVKNVDGTWSWSITPSTAITNQTVTITATDEDGGLSTATFALTAVVDVVERRLFYNNSAFETVGGVAAALDTSKVILRSSSTAQATTFDNVSNFSLGLNGAVLNVAGLANTALTAADFIFRVAPPGASGVVNPSTWSNAPAPSAIVVTAGNSTTPAAIQLEWANNQIENTWLQIIVRANSNTGLTAPAVFYLGHAQAEVNGVSPYRVSVADLLLVQAAVSTNIVSVNDVRDVNKDRRVSVADLTFMQPRVSNNVNLNNITVPVAGSTEEGSGPSNGPAVPSLARAATDSTLGALLGTPLPLSGSAEKPGEKSAGSLALGEEGLPTFRSGRISPRAVRTLGAPIPEVKRAVAGDVVQPSQSANVTDDSLDAKWITLVDDYFGNW